MKNDQLKSAFNRSGDDMSKMLLEEYEGKSDAWDIQFAWHHFSNHGVSNKVVFTWLEIAWRF